MRVLEKVGFEQEGFARKHTIKDGELIDVCLLYTSDAADERSSVDLGGRRIIKKKKKIDNSRVS